MGKPQTPRPLRDKDFLEFLDLPTAPFFESAIERYFYRAAIENRIPHFWDSQNNLILGATGPKPYLKMLTRSRAPVPLFVAHMDHPGFCGLSWEKKKNSRTLPVLIAKWLGGSPTRHINGQDVYIAHQSKRKADSYSKIAAKKIARGKIVTHQFDANHLLTTIRIAIQKPIGKTSKNKKLEAAIREIPARELFGAFDFRPQKKGSHMLAPAVDDGVGALAAFEILVQCRKEKIPALALFTRAEEVGFVGMLRHLSVFSTLDPTQNTKSRSSKKAARPGLGFVFTSVECSRQRENAVVGRGPIVRLGDKSGVFSPMATRLMMHSALQCQKQNKTKRGKAKKIMADSKTPRRGFQFQHRLMDGGTCEGGIAAGLGLESAGLAIPLGNYHNTALDAWPREYASKSRRYTPAPEYFHVDDFFEAITLGVQFARDLHKERGLHRIHRVQQLTQTRARKLLREYRGFR